MSLSYKVVESDSKLKTLLNLHLRSTRKQYIEVGPKNIILSAKFKNIYERIEHFEVRDEDVLILGFPKSGTRLMQEMAWLLLNDLDFKTAREKELEFRSHYFEGECFCDNIKPEYLSLPQIDQLESPRCLKSHLHWSLLPKAIRNEVQKPKMIVTLRCPEDVCTSYYYQSKFENFSGSWDDFCDLFLGGIIPFGPYWEHVLSFWEQRHRPNILFIKYSDMVKDLSGSIRNVAKFLDKTVSEDEVSQLYDYLHFDNLKQNPTFALINKFKFVVNPFTRRGVVDDHKTMMSPEVIEQFRQQTKMYLSGTGINF